MLSDNWKILKVKNLYFFQERKMGDSDSLSFNQIQGTQTISLLFEYLVFHFRFSTVLFNILKFYHLKVRFLGINNSFIGIKA